MSSNSEQFSRALIDDELKYSGWDILNSQQVRFEVSGQSGRADYVLLESHGPICVIEAKNHDKDPYDAKEQARAYAEELKAPFIILSNGTTHWFWNLGRADYEDAYRIERLPSPEDLQTLRLKNLTKPSPLSSEVVTKDYVKPYNPAISLRQYQIDALNEVAKQFDNDSKRQFLLEMATGTGKTLLCAALILRFLKSKNAQRVLFIVDRIELAKQTMEEFDVILRDYGPVIYKNARKRPAELLGSSVVVATIQSLMVDRRFRKEFTPFHFDLVVNDEAHRSIYGDSREAVQFFQGTRIGLTATPKAYLKNIDTAQLARENPKALEARQLRDTYSFFGCEPGEPTYRYDIIDAVNDPDGPYLCSPTIFDIRSDITTQALDDAGWAVTVNEQEESFKVKDLERKILIPQRNELMCRNLLEKGLTEPNGQMGKVIVFCVNQNHATAVTKILNSIQPESAVTITSRVDDSSTIAKDFRDGKRKEKIAVSVDMLSTGYNCKDLLNVALFRPIFSPTEYIQIKGRGTRLFTFIHDGQSFEKKTFHILDYCGVASYFEDEYDYSEPLKLPVTGGIQKPEGTVVGTPTGADGDGGFIKDVPDDTGTDTGTKVIPVWTGMDIIISEENHIVGPEGEKVDVMTYRGRFEKELSVFAQSSPDLLTAVDEEDDDTIEEILNERFLFRPESYFSAEKLMKAYGIPATIAGFIYSVLGKKSLPTKRDLSKDTASSLSSLYDLSYEQERWLETTANLLIDDPRALDSFIKDDLASVFQGPQFAQLGGIATLRNFQNRELVFDSLRNSVLVQQAVKAGSA